MGNKKQDLGDHGDSGQSQKKRIFVVANTEKSVAEAQKRKAARKRDAKIKRKQGQHRDHKKLDYGFLRSDSTLRLIIVIFFVHVKSSDCKKFCLTNIFYNLTPRLSIKSSIIAAKLL